MLNNSLGGLKFGIDGEGNYGYFGDDDVLVPFSDKNISFGNTLLMGKGETKIIPLDFTPDFVCIASDLVYDSYNRIHAYCGIISNISSTEITYSPSMRWMVVNGNTFSNIYNSCDYIDIAKNEIKITDAGYGVNNVFWIAVKTKK